MEMDLKNRLNMRLSLLFNYFLRNYYGSKRFEMKFLFFSPGPVCYETNKNAGYRIGVLKNGKSS